MYQAILLEMSDTAREYMEEILEEIETLEQEVEKKNMQLAEKNEFIDDLTSPRWYVEMAVVCLMSYLYGAWMGVYMCPK
jgi:hypothetical protein